MLISEFISIFREGFNKGTRLLIGNERTRKKWVVYFYNLQAIFSKKVVYSHNKEFIFDYKRIVANKKHICKEEYRANAFYGIASCLRSYSGYSGEIDACIEHGVYFGDYVNDEECKTSGFPAVFTFGAKRFGHLRSKSQKLIFTIGPYIHYAHDLLEPSEIKQLKERWGKTLLVFPTHSVDRISVEMNSHRLVEEIESFKQDHYFKTVFVCLYYRDIELGRDKEYLKAGYKVVSAGRREDKDFLNRLHTFFSLADYSISNNVGTHIGYSVAMNVPHTVIPEDVIYNVDSKLEEKHVTTLHNDTAVIEKKQVRNVFLEYSETITEIQKRICNVYWGNSCIRKPEEIYYMFKISNTIFKESGKKEENFLDVSRYYTGQHHKDQFGYLYKQAISGVKNK